MTDTASAEKIAAAGKIYEDLAAYAKNMGGSAFNARNTGGIPPAPEIRIAGDWAYITARFSFPLTGLSEEVS
jgi:hypothetical protein